MKQHTIQYQAHNKRNSAGWLSDENSFVEIKILILVCALSEFHWFHKALHEQYLLALITMSTFHKTCILGTAFVRRILLCSYLQSLATKPSLFESFNLWLSWKSFTITNAQLLAGLAISGRIWTNYQHILSFFFFNNLHAKNTSP